MLPLFNTVISKGASLAVQRVLDSTYVNTGQVADAFETALASKFCVPKPVCVNSGTSALHLGLIVGGIQPGDEVIIPAQTFVASGFAVMMAGAIPVFVDIESMTGNMLARAIESKITQRTRAIMVVHWAGMPCDMEEIDIVARKYGLWVIEDAAHALGARYCGVAIGSLSRFTAFSFQAIKHLTTADGGALVCTDAADAEVARRLRWFGMDRTNTEFTDLGERADILTRLGFKYAMNDFTAALGMANLDIVEATIQHARYVARIYREELSGLRGVICSQGESIRSESSYWFFPVFVDRPVDIIRYMARNGVQISCVHTRIDRQPVFGGERDLKNQAWFTAHHVGLPTHTGVTDEHLMRIIELMRRGW